VVLRGAAHELGDLRCRSGQRHRQGKPRLEVGRLVAPVGLSVAGIGQEAEIGQAGAQRVEERHLGKDIGSPVPGASFR
jgi:hypothetical protein